MAFSLSQYTNALERRRGRLFAAVASPVFQRLVFLYRGMVAQPETGNLPCTAAAAVRKTDEISGLTGLILLKNGGFKVQLIRWRTGCET